MTTEFNLYYWLAQAPDKAVMPRYFEGVLTSIAVSKLEGTTQEGEGKLHTKLSWGGYKFVTTTLHIGIWQLRHFTTMKLILTLLGEWTLWKLIQAAWQQLLPVGFTILGMSLYKTLLPYCSGFENFRCMGFLTSGFSSRNCNKIRNGLIHAPQSFNCHHKPAGCGGLFSTERDSATPQNLLITSGSSANGFMCSGPESCKNFMM